MPRGLSKPLSIGMASRKVILHSERPMRPAPVWMHTPEVREFQVFRSRFVRWCRDYGFSATKPKRQLKQREAA